MFYDLPVGELLRSRGGTNGSCAQFIDKVHASWPGCKLMIQELPKSVTSPWQHWEKYIDSRTFFAVRSRWIIWGWWFCRYVRPLAMSSNIDRFNTNGMFWIDWTKLSRLQLSSSMRRMGSWLPGRKTHPKKLGDVGMSQIQHQLAFLDGDVLNAGIISVEQQLVQPFASTHQSTHFDLKKKKKNRWIVGGHSRLL